MDPPISPLAADATWNRLDALFDELIAMPAAERAAAIARMAGDDAALKARLLAFQRALDIEDSPLDLPASALLQASTDDVDGSADRRVGPWRLVALLGRGGMGDVHRAERCDSTYEQHVAIKLLRNDSRTLVARFLQERRIVARLDHPGIARLIDGDIDARGRPYMVMELVEGTTLNVWCAQNRPSLETRLDLFAQVCDAVAYAHRHLVVHRDLKPANVMVTPKGRVKLLDFGIARLLDSPTGDTTRSLNLTPGYAAPEQLTGAPITTSADVYALGLLLHELLCGKPAHAVRDLPLAAAMQRILSEPPSPPSRVARVLPDPPVAPSLVAGDLDAIVARALRVEPERRYASVDELAADVARCLRHEPVQARRGGWAYVAGRTLRRHRAASVASAGALLALLAGSSAVLWQARLANDAAARANAEKNFLVQVFKASDPRAASDTPRGAITARALLDAGAARVDAEFRDQPALQIELLGTIASLYRELREPARYKAIVDRRVALANRWPGRYPQVGIEALQDQIADDLVAARPQQASPRVADVDARLKAAGLDDSLLRAVWWTQKAAVEPNDDYAAQKRDLAQALTLYDRHAPHSPERVHVLAQMGDVEMNAQHLDEAIARWRIALQAAHDADEPMEGDTIDMLTGVGMALSNVGRLDEALSTFEHAAHVAERTYGDDHPSYWRLASEYGTLLSMNGRRDDADALLESVRRKLPAQASEESAMDLLVNYAQVLSSQGAPERGLAWLEQGASFYATHPVAPYASRRTRLILGNAYSLLGRRDDARRLLKGSYDDYVAQDPPSSQARLGATERWARILVEDGRIDEARQLFEQVLAADAGRHLSVTALAQLGLARVALAEHRPSDAVVEARRAQDRWKEVRGWRDVRAGNVIQRIYAHALLATGDAPGARAAAAAAMADSQRWDLPTAASLRDERAMLAQAAATTAAR